MLVLFFVCLFLCIIHFIYDKIILPMIRLNYRHKLFEQRDIIRNELLSNKGTEQYRVALIVHDALNNSINRLHLINIEDKVKFNAWKARNPNDYQAIISKINLIKNNGSRKSNNVFVSTSKILQKVAFFNSLLILLYLLPIVILAIIISVFMGTLNKIFSSLGKFNSFVALINDKELKKLKHL